MLCNKRTHHSEKHAQPQLQSSPARRNLRKPKNSNKDPAQPGEKKKRSSSSFRLLPKRRNTSDFCGLMYLIISDLLCSGSPMRQEGNTGKCTQSKNWGRSFELTSDRQQCHISNEFGVGVYEGRVGCSCYLEKPHSRPPTLENKMNGRPPQSKCKGQSGERIGVLVL
ncbi:hypothetical protein MJT46_002545 [Ovis ammon polii x Ovis aries]|nr:hypothetical protein MJT46_002545 [Ovis ammon polii x Ovis aries]